MTRTTPRVDQIEWGKIEAAGRTFKDVKLSPGGARAWDWRETGTQHVPGIQLADAEDLLEAGADIIVLSRGMDLVLLVPATTIQALEARGVEVRVAQSKEAARMVNELIDEGRRVGALIHSTC
ncbi:MAG TPA: Mth938-like domain-containing protein [Byssovorax sp.]